MKVIIEKNGNVTIDFENDLLVTSHKNIGIKDHNGTTLTICNAHIIGSKVCNSNLSFGQYIRYCIKECIKRYVK